MRGPVLVSMLAAALLLGACSGGPSVRSSTDSATGVTVVSMSEPVVLARQQRNLAEAARDYLYLGPVGLSERGRYQQYLWLGLGSTIDRSLAAVSFPDPTTVVLILDGVPMALNIEDWPAEGTLPYDVSVETELSLAARVTQSQLQRIAIANEVEAVVELDGGAFHRFVRWTGDRNQWSSLSAADVAPGP